jgi:hypothetical protein
MSDAEADLWAEAEAIASKTRPVAKITPLTGAFIGLCTAFFAAQILTIVTGIGRDTDPAWLVTFALAFIGPFVYLRLGQRNHLAAAKRAYATLQATAQPIGQPMAANENGLQPPAQSKD